MRTLLVLGGAPPAPWSRTGCGTGSTAHEWHIAVVDQDDEHHYQPGYLFVPFGDATARPRWSARGTASSPTASSSCSPRSTASTPTARTVALVDGREPGLRLPGHRHRYDAAAGPDPGHARPRVAHAASSTSTPSTAPRRWRPRWPSFDERPAGRAHHRDADQVPGGTAGVHLPRRGLAAPSAGCATGSSWSSSPRSTARSPSRSPPSASARCSTSARSGVETDFLVEHIDQDRTVLVSYDEREVPFDLLVTVPLNMGADFVARSGLGDELNYVPVDKHTLLSTAYDDDLRPRRRQRHPDLEGRLGRALRGRRLRRQLPRARRRAGR